MHGGTHIEAPCPICGTKILVPLTLKYRRGEDAIVTVDESGIALHVGLAHGTEALDELR